MLFLVSLSAGSYFLYYFGHSADLRDYYLRRLLVSTDNAEQEIDRLKRNFQKTLKYRQASEETENGGTETFKFDDSEFESKIRLIPAFEPVSDPSCEQLEGYLQRPAGAAGDTGSNGEPLATAQGSGKDLRTYAGWAGSSAVLCFSAADDTGRTLTSPPARMAKLLEPVLPIEDFDSVLLTRQDGEVLLLQQHPYMAVDVVRLDISEIQEFANLDGDDHAPSRELELEHTAIGEFAFAEQQFLVFVQPLRLPVALDWTTPNLTSKEQTWFLMGLKEKGRFRAEAMAISPTAMLIILSLVVLALFAMPYLKLRFIGSREALHKHDILVIAITLMVALSSITLALLELQMRAVWQDDVDERLGLVADDITNSFNEEVGAIACQLRRLTNIRDTISPKTDPSTPQLLTKDYPLSEYPLLEMAYWMDADGQQIEKWSIKDATTPLLNVKDRGYFKDALELDFTNSAVIRNQQQGWVVESIRSRNTGEVSSVVSLNSVGQETCGDGDPPLAEGIPDDQEMADDEGMSGDQGSAADRGKPVVAAAYTSLQSVIDPVLPPDFQFAVIDDQGNVLFHQDPSRNLTENLFHWVNKQDALRAAVWSGNNRPKMDVVYRSRDYRLHLRPLEPTPWTLVVLYDIHDARLARVDILTVAFLFFLIYLTLFLIAYFYLWARTRETLKNPLFIWLWPSQGRVHVYVGSLLIAAVGGIAWLLLFWKSSGTEFNDQVSLAALTAMLGLVVFGFFYKLLRLANAGKLRFVDAHHGRRQFRSLPWYAVTLLVAVIAWPERLSTDAGVTAAVALVLLVVFHGIAVRFSHPFTRWKPSLAASQWLHLAALCAVVGVIAALPQFIFYGIAHDEIMELSTQREQLNWSDSLAERHHRHVDRYQAIAMRAETEELIESHLELTGSGSLGPAWDVHGVGTSESGNLNFVVEEWKAPANRETDICAEEQDRSLSDRVNSAILFVASLVPGFTAESYELRSLASADHGGDWCWLNGDEPGRSDDSQPASSDDTGESLTFVRKRYRNDVGFGQPVAPGNDAPQSGPDAKLSFVDLKLGTPISYYSPPSVLEKTWLYALLVFLVLVGITKNLLRYVYLMDLRIPAFLSGDCWPSTTDRRHRLVLRGSEWHQGSGGDKDRYHTIDTTHIESDEVLEGMLRQALESDKKIICMTHFHIGLWNQAIAERKLTMLERLLTSGRQLEVRSDINPMHFFLMRSRDYLRGNAESNPDLGRWSAVLAEFTRCRPSRDIRKHQAELLCRLRKERRHHGLEKTTTALKLLADECCSHYELEEIAVTIARHPDFKTLATDEDFPASLINQVQDQADPYYRLLWAISSKDERMVLYHVAANGFISWRSNDVLLRLVHRGLIQMVPHPRIMNRSFWQHVQNAEMSEVLEQWKAEAGASGWTRLKAPLLVAVGLAMVFLFSTQPQLLRQGIAFTAILTAGAPALIKLISMLTQARDWGGSRH